MAKEDFNAAVLYSRNFFDYFFKFALYYAKFSLDFNLNMGKADALFPVEAFNALQKYSITFQSTQFRLVENQHWLTFENKHLISIYKISRKVPQLFQNKVVPFSQ